MASHNTLRIARCAGRVHQRPGVRQRDVLCWLPTAAGRKKILISAVTRWKRAGTEVDEAVRLDRQILADFLDHTGEFILDNECCSFCITDDELDFLANQPEVDGESNETGLRSGGKYFAPFDAVVGKDSDPVALGEPETEQGVGEPARALVPLREGHRALKVASADPAGRDPGMDRKHLSEVQEVFQEFLLMDWLRQAMELQQPDRDPGHG